MRARTLIAVGALALAGSGLVMPAASAAEPDTATATAARLAAEVPPDCVSNQPVTFFALSCYRRAPGNDFRAGINCTNSGLRWGPWRQQTADLSTVSRVACPAGGTIEVIKIQFRD